MISILISSARPPRSKLSLGVNVSNLFVFHALGGYILEDPSEPPAGSAGGGGRLGGRARQRASGSPAPSDPSGEVQ